MLIIIHSIVAKYKNCTDCLGSSENERRHDKLEKKRQLVKTDGSCRDINPFKPEFIIVIFIHYKPRIAVAILDL